MDWDQESVLEVMRKCKTREELKRNYKGAYRYAMRNKFLFANLPSTRIRWTYESVMAKANKYDMLERFRKDWSGAYHYAMKHGFIEEVRAKLKRRFINTYEHCKRDSLKYSRRSEWEYSKDGSTYQTAKRKGWLDELCYHMTPRHESFDKEKHYWSVEEVKAIAKSYNSRKQFTEENYSAYIFARKHHILEDIFSHIPKKGSLYHRCVYAAEFADYHVYVGLTINYNRRTSDHLKDANSSVYKHIQSSGLRPTFKMVHDYCPSKKAAELEGLTLQWYTDNGWKPLNKVKTGGLGCAETCAELKYSLDFIISIANKYEYICDFRKHDRRLYSYAEKHGWIELLGLKRKRNTRRLSQSEIRHIASKYKSPSIFFKEQKKAYKEAKELGIWEELKEKMPDRRICRTWTQADIPLIYETAKKYKRRRHFQLAEPAMYSAAQHLGVINEVCAHMPTRKCNYEKKRGK